MKDFLAKLQKISKQSNILIWEKNLIEKRISNIQENINEYDEMKERYIKEVELKKNQLLNNKNKHLIKCQKMEELNKKLNEILIRKQNIDDEEDRLVILKQMDIVNKTFDLLKNVQKLSDSLETTREEYQLTAEQIRNHNFNNRKTINMLNCFLKKNLANVQSREEYETNEKAEGRDECQNKGKDVCESLDEGLDERLDKNLSEGLSRSATGITKIPKEIKGNTEKNVNKETYKMLKIIPTKEMNTNLINLFSQSHTTLPLEKQQFLFVFEMNILNRIANKQRKRKNKSAEMNNKADTEQKGQKESNKEGEKENEKEREKEETEGQQTEKQKEEEKEKENDEREQNNEKYNKMIHQFLYQYYITA